MTKQIVTLCVRLFSIWLALISLQIFMMVKIVSQQDPSMAGLVYILPLLPIIFAIFLWRYPSIVAGRLLAGTEAAADKSMSVRQAAAVGSMVLGLWAVLSSLPTVVRTLLMVFALADRMPVVDALMPMSAHADFFGALVLGAVGVFLVLKPGVIADRVGDLGR